MTFDAPQAKRVKRSEYLKQNSDDDSIHGFPAPEQPSSYSFQYDLVESDKGEPELSTRTKTFPSINKNENSSDNELYEFRLFASKTKGKGQSALSPGTVDDVEATIHPQAPSLTKIRIHSPTPTGEISLSTCSFVAPCRPQSYYFTSALPQDELDAHRERIRVAAVSGNDLFALYLQQRWPGMAYPWKVISTAAQSNHTKTNRPDSKVPTTATKLQLANRRPKPSKKRRIILRRRIADKKAVMQAQRAVRLSKSSQNTSATPGEPIELTQEEKEKRTRRNREKKVKRKEREKRKKLETTDQHLDQVTESNDT